MFSRTLALTLLALLPGALFAASAEVETLPDPTRPVLYDFNASPGNLLGSLLVPTPTYTLSSVLVREETRIAVINSQRVRVGDTVDGARVRSIDSAGATLERNGEQITLALYAAPIKTLVNNDGQ